MSALEGRGQLSSIDKLPEEAEPDIVWANDELRERRMPANAILQEFNARLADRGIKGISKSAWGRHSIRKAVQFRKIDQGHAILREIKSQINEDAPDEATMVIGEMIKVAVFQALENGADDAKTLGMLARTLRTTVKAQIDTVEYRDALADHKARLDKAKAAVMEAGAKAGVGKDTLDKITNLLTTGSA